MKYLVILFLLLIGIHAQAQTTLSKVDGQWSLLVDGQPFTVKGVTFGYDEDVENYDQYFSELNSLGVNTIRTWGNNKNTKQLLDAADRHGFKVMLGIWMRHGRPGMEADDRFDYLNDTGGRETMYNQALEAVKNYKDHPALLTWGIGNEVYLNTASDQEKIAYSKLLEKICQAIKKIDPDHPITSVEAWVFGLDWWPTYVPSIDIYGVNVYGPGADILPQEFVKKGVDKPYIITEYGVRGEWDIEKDKYGVKPEPTDQEKYQTIVKGYHEWIKPKPDCLGVYIFHYASGANFVAPWLLTHFKGLKRPQYWAIREAYTGQKPINYVPRIDSFRISNTIKNSGSWVPVTLEVFDQEQEELSFDFYYNHRAGSRKRRDQVKALNVRGNPVEGFEIQLPRVDGGIKVYAAVRDTYDNVGMATTSIAVEDQQESDRQYLVPRVELPFYVYYDNKDLPYTPSAYMGNYKQMIVDLAHKENVQSGKTAIKIRYDANREWYGLGFVDPANDWGDILGGYDISAATTFSFWAKASYDNLVIKAGFGLIEDDRPFPDTAKKLIEVELTKAWKKYTIKTKRLDLSCIRSGFVIFVGSEGLTHDIFIDNIVFE